MKYIKIFMLICTVLVGSQSIASVIKNKNLLSLAPVPEVVQTSRELIKDIDAVSDDSKESEANEKGEVKSVLTPEMINDLRTCKPYNEKFDFEIIGINISFRIKIDGWTDGKCTYHMSGKVNSLGKEIRETFGLTIPDKTIAQFEPKVMCGFDKDQLGVLVDAIVEEDKRNIAQLNGMLKNPDPEFLMQSSQDLTPQEQKLVDMIVEQNVCTIVNQDELIKLFTELNEKKK